MKRIQKPTKKKRRLPRVPVPPPAQVLRDSRLRREADALRREIDEELERIDELLEEE